MRCRAKEEREIHHWTNACTKRQWLRLVSAQAYGTLRRRSTVTSTLSLCFVGCHDLLRSYPRAYESIDSGRFSPTYYFLVAKDMLLCHAEAILAVLGRRVGDIRMPSRLECRLRIVDGRARPPLTANVHEDGWPRPESGPQLCVYYLPKTTRQESVFCRASTRPNSREKS
jgi:hypothetical protein